MQNATRCKGPDTVSRDARDVREEAARLHRYNEPQHYELYREVEEVQKGGGSGEDSAVARDVTAGCSDVNEASGGGGRRCSHSSAVDAYEEEEEVVPKAV